ncbi:MAG: hypothetical protein ABF636_10480 [Acetobacter sp.]
MYLDVTQPIAVIVAAAITNAAGMISIFLTIRQNSSFKRNENRISEINTEINDVNKTISNKLANLKETEIKLSSKYRMLDILTVKWQKTQDCTAELLGIMDLHFNDKCAISEDEKKRVSYLCNFLSLQESPKGKFNEEFNVQLDSIKYFLLNNTNIIASYTEFYSVFKLNCWYLIDHRLNEINQSLESGKIVSLPKIEPHKVEKKYI